MMLEWNEWECPRCRRIGQVDPERGYSNGEVLRMSCPACGSELAVLCDYQPAFVAYRAETFGSSIGMYPRGLADKSEVADMESEGGRSTDDLERRIEHIERLLNHKGER